MTKWANSNSKEMRTEGQSKTVEMEELDVVNWLWADTL